MRRVRSAKLCAHTRGEWGRRTWLFRRTSATRRSERPSSVARWPTSRVVQARRSSFCTAIPPRPTGGATSFPISSRSAAASRPTSSAWASRPSSTTAAPAATALLSIASISMRCWRHSAWSSRSCSCVTTGARRSRSTGANRHRDAVEGVVYMEAIVQPLIWDDWPEAARRVFEGFRSPAGEDMVLDKNMFVERVLPGAIMRPVVGCRDDGLSAALPGVRREPPPDAYLAARDPDRRRARRHGDDRCRLRVMAGRVRYRQIVRQRRSRIDPDRPAAGLLPHLAQSGGSHGKGLALHPRRFTR